MRHIPNTLDHLGMKLHELNYFNKAGIEHLEETIQLLNNTISQLKTEIELNGFASEEDEIYFFRHVNPSIYSLQIICKKIIKIESMRLASSRKEINFIIKSKLSFVKAHYADYFEFIRYYNSTSSIHDRRYFLRSQNMQKDPFIPICDQNYTTGYDLVVAYFLAYKFLNALYIDENLESLLQKESSTTSKWTAGMADAVELISGIKAIGAVNNGDVGLMTLNNSIGKILNIDIKDLYGKRREIKERKGEKCKFLKQMIIALENELDTEAN